MRLRRLTTLAAATILAPALVVVPMPAMGEPGPTPVESTTEETSLVDPESPVVGDGGVAVERDKKLAKDTTPEAAETTEDVVVLGVTGRQVIDTDLAVIGVTWEGDDHVAVQYRTETADGWGPWNGVDTDLAESDDVEAEEEARAGSDPIVVTDVVAVQARMLGSETDEPQDPKLSVIDPGESAADANPDQVKAGSAHAAAARPNIRSRAQWGADESIRRGTPSYGRVNGTIVHHTAGTNNYSQAQVPAIMRGIYAFHVRDRGWSDIGYNVLVDRFGGMWEGRAGGLDRAVVGAHASGFNSVTFGISLMGDYTRVQPSSAAIESMNRVIAWKSTIHGFAPRGSFVHQGRSYRAISGHRDVGSTSCPGLIYNQLSAMATRVNALRGTGHAGGAQQPGVNPPSTPIPAPAPAPAPVGASLNVRDAMFIGSNGRLFAVSPTGTTITSARQINAGNWRGFDRIMVSGDINGDRQPDLISRRPSDGALVMHAGNGTRGVQGGRVIGYGWNQMSHIVAVGDWDGDGRNDLLAVQRSTGRLLLYSGHGNARFASGRQIGNGWQVFSHVLAVGDYNGDGRPDIVGIRPNGQAHLYRGDGRGGFIRGGAVDLGRVNGYTTFVGLAGTRGILGVRPNGSAAILRPGRTGLQSANVAPHFRGARVMTG